MDNISDEYNYYWETNMFLQTEEIDSWVLEEAFNGLNASNSQTVSTLDVPSKNISLERKRRKKLNDSILALRAVVPNITKMDKASAVKDAIEYIKELQEQEKEIEAEILNLRDSIQNSATSHFSHQPQNSNKKGLMNHSNQSFPLEILDLSVIWMGERRMVVSLTCNRRKDTIWKVYRLIESLGLKIITATANVLDQRILKTIYIEAEEEEKDEIKIKIETAMAATMINGAP